MFTLIKTVAKKYSRSYSTKTYDSSKLLSAVADLHKFDIHLKNFPTLVFLGPQSSGKSSAVQAITGDYILPVDMKVATKKPTHITTIRSEQTKYTVGTRELYTVKDVANEIDRLNRNESVKKIDVLVNSPKVHNCTFVDLPGLFSVSNDDSDNQFRKQVKKIAQDYITDPNNIPVVVHAAPSDPATSPAIKMISNANRRTDALGVLTKMDMVRGQKTAYLERMLNGSEYQMGHGYCAVVLPNDSDIERGVSVEEKIKSEAEYFKKMPQIKPAGIPALRKMISDIQAKKISEHIPEILANVDSQVALLQSSKNFLQNLSSGTDSSLSRNLRIMIEKLVSSSQERAEFEDILKKELKKSIRARLNISSDWKNKDGLTRSIKTVDNPMIWYFQSKTADCESYVQNVKEKGTYGDDFKQLFGYGTGTPIFIDNVKLSDAYNQEVILGSALELLQPIIDDNLGVKRIKWNRELNRHFATLLTDDSIHAIIKDTTLSLLLNYINSGSDLTDQSSHQFVQYVIGQIGNEVFESKIKYSITAMLNLEKRPNVSVTEIMRSLLSKYPEMIRIPQTALFTPKIQKYQMEIFGSEWINAYNDVVIDNISENCYRNVAVNLIDLMVEKLLEMTIDMFHKENTQKEQNKVDQKLQKLLEVKQILIDSQK